MSRLAYMGRPWVAFDPAIKKHREWFAHFQHEKSWSHCPVRFIIGDDAGDLVTLCQRRLIDYYTKREFNKSTVQVAPGSQ